MFDVFLFPNHQYSLVLDVHRAVRRQIIRGQIPILLDFLMYLDTCNSSYGLFMFSAKYALSRIHYIIQRLIFE